MHQLLKSTRGVLTAVFLSLIFLANLGCSPSKGEVSGTVTYKGQKVTGGSVVFHSTEGKGSVPATIGEDGTYSAPKVPSGEVKVTVETDSVKPATGAKNRPPAAMMPPAGADVPKDAADGSIYSGKAKIGKYVQIPDTYASPEKTSLTFIITGGKQTIDLELK